MTEIAVDSDLPGKVDAYMRALVELDKFSGSILIARDGEVLMSSGYGFANREHRVVNTPQTKFRLGSITKQFTAMAIMLLRDQGKFNVHDSIAMILPALRYCRIERRIRISGADYPLSDPINIPFTKYRWRNG